MAALEACSGDLGRLNLQVQLQLCEIQTSLDPIVYDSFKRLNSKYHTNP